MRYLFLLFITVLAGCATTTLCAPANSKKDVKLVGTWLGERGTESDCPYASWATTRDPEGSFVITFYSDPERKVFTGREYGYWWTKSGMFYILLPRIMQSSDSYKYDVQENGEVISFRDVSADRNSVCGHNYQFRDVKVKP